MGNQALSLYGSVSYNSNKDLPGKNEIGARLRYYRKCMLVTGRLSYLMREQDKAKKPAFLLKEYFKVLARNKARVLIEQLVVLSIYLSRHNILSTYDGDHIGWHVMFGHRIESL